MKRLLIVVTIITAFALCTFGQTTTAPTAAELVAERVARLTALLTLTAAEQTQATTIFTAEETAVSTLRTSIQTAQTAIQTAVEKNDLTGINTQAAQIGSLTTQEVSAAAKAEAAFYLILTAAQQTTYNTLKLFGFDGFGGPGAPFGPGGPGRGGPHR